MIYFDGKPGKSQENQGETRKSQEKPGKARKTREKPSSPGKTRVAQEKHPLSWASLATQECQWKQIINKNTCQGLQIVCL